MIGASSNYKNIHLHPSGDHPHHRHPMPSREPLSGFVESTPENNIPIGLLPESIRQVKHAFNSCLTISANFGHDVEDGDLVVPLIGAPWSVHHLPPKDICFGTILETVWVPAFRTNRYPIDCPHEGMKPIQPRLEDMTEEEIEALELRASQIAEAAAKLVDAEADALENVPDGALGTGLISDLVHARHIGNLPYYGVAYKKEGKVMLGPVVAHPRFAFPVGAKLYAAPFGDVTIHKTDVMVGVCIAPGYLYLMPYAAEIDRLAKHINDLAQATDDKIQAIVDKIIDEGIDISNCTVLVPGTTTERPLYDRFGDWVNIKDFGAVGDGSTNNATYIDAAIAHAQKLGGNACLFIPVGNFATSKLPSVPCYGPGTITWRQRAYKPFELLFTLRGGVSADIDGRYFVDCKDIIADDSGLSVDKDGNIKVDFTGISDEKRQEIVESLLPDKDDNGTGGGGLDTDENGNIIINISNMNKEELKKFILDVIGDMDVPIFPNPDDGHLDFDFDNMTEEQLRKLIYRLIQQGGGLDVSESGQIFVDFSLMPSDKFDKVLFDLGIPVTLKESLTLYVDGANGQDARYMGAGETEETAFRTIQYAVTYASYYYRLGPYSIIIKIKAGTYNEDISFGGYDSTTGGIYLQPYTPRTSNSSSYSVRIVERHGASISDGLWVLQDLNIVQGGGGGTSNLYAPHILTVHRRGQLYLMGCLLENNAAQGHTSNGVVCTDGGKLTLECNPRYNHIVMRVGSVFSRAIWCSVGGFTRIPYYTASQDGYVYISGAADICVCVEMSATVMCDFAGKNIGNAYGNIGTLNGFSGDKYWVQGGSFLFNVRSVPGGGTKVNTGSFVGTV